MCLRISLPINRVSRNLITDIKTETLMRKSFSERPTFVRLIFQKVIPGRQLEIYLVFFFFNDFPHVPLVFCQIEFTFLFISALPFANGSILDYIEILQAKINALVIEKSEPNEEF